MLVLQVLDGVDLLDKLKYLLDVYWHGRNFDGFLIEVTSQPNVLGVVELDKASLVLVESNLHPHDLSVPEHLDVVTNLVALLKAVGRWVVLHQIFFVKDVELLIVKLDFAFKLLVD